MFAEKPAKTADFLDVDWVPNQNLGRFSENKKLIDFNLRKFKIPQTVLILSLCEFTFISNIYM